MSDTEASRPIGDLDRLIEILAKQAETSRRSAEIIESRVLPLLERIAVALERSPAMASTPSKPSADARALGFFEFRRAIGQGLWDQADSIVRAMIREHPDDPEVAALTEELGRSRQFAVDDLRQRIEAARLANDPEGAIKSRDELAQILHGEAIQEIDRALVRWLIGLIQRRLRIGTVRPDVVALATRISESFGATTEGASLRASLPTLRRSAGLCPRCAEPYPGVGEACPKCLAAAATMAAPTEPPFETAPEPEDPDSESIGEPIDFNNERFWQ